MLVHGVSQKGIPNDHAIWTPSRFRHRASSPSADPPRMRAIGSERTADRGPPPSHFMTSWHPGRHSTLECRPTMARESHKQKLLTEGLRVVHERGYGGASVRDIVAAAGVPHGSFTNHFASKEAFGLE